MLSLNNIASDRRVHGNKFCCPGPEAASQPKKWKRKRDTLTVYMGHDGDIRVNCHHPKQDPIECKDYVRRIAGLPAWKPKTRKRPAHYRDAIPFKTRNMFVGETLQVCRYRQSIGSAIELDWFRLLANDTLRPKTEANKNWVRWYGIEFGLEGGIVEQIIETVRPRNYSADERAIMLTMTYAERQLLGLRRTGSIDVDKERRERARRDRYNAKRRAEREAERRIMSRKPVDTRSQIRGGVNRCNPSLKKICSTRLESESQERIRGLKLRIMKSSIITKIGLKKRRAAPENHSSVPRTMTTPHKTAPLTRPETVPFGERVDLMMQHLGLCRAEAEMESLRWESGQVERGNLLRSPWRAVSGVAEGSEAPSAGTSRTCSPSIRRRRAGA
jgi:hypothetical protein